MTLTFSLADITLIVAFVALAVTFLAYVTLWRKLAHIKSVDRELDARALVQEFSQRSKRLEERLVDQKVRLEILELRQQRQKESSSGQNVLSPGMSQPNEAGKLPFERRMDQVPEKKELLSGKASE